LRVLIAAAVFHLAFTAAIFVIGRNSILPAAFDKTGTAISVAPDGVGYLEDAAILAQLLKGADFITWINAPYNFHTKLYSICFVLFGPLLGSNILPAEPLNLLYYLGILTLVYKLGTETFSSRAGIIAAVIVALWPSFLLHTTQLLKDPVFVLGMLALILIMVRWLTQTGSWRRCLLQGLLGAVLATVLWKTRADLGPVVFATIFLGAFALVVQQLRSRRVTAANLFGMALLVVLTAASVLFLPVYNSADHPSHHDRKRIEAANPKAKPVVRWWQVGAEIGIVRKRFVDTYPGAGSLIDSEAQVTSNSDLIRYFPRAALVGFAAPFPNMWFQKGSSVGSSGRALSGLETLLMYTIEALAIVGLWQGRRRLSVWLLFSIAAMGCITLGFVVINIGALYRLRYAFLILLIILAAGGVAHILDWARTKRLPPQKARA
jgi:4-amino-4-deoxy-L-arabinose transferase-like glycosyltransferase